MSTTNLQQRLQDLLTSIQQGKIMEAMKEFYDVDTVMQDNTNPPTKGLAANIEREKQFLSGVKEWKGFQVVASGVGDNATFYECVMEFIATNGQPVRLEQVSAAKWKNGKIVHERFYYDTGKQAS
ncbi:MAG: SnoaL-like domain-containing protein [Nitrospira sp.]